MGADPYNPEIIDTKIQHAFMQVDIRTKIHYCFYGEHQFNGMPWDNPMWPIPDVSYEPKEQHFAEHTELTRYLRLWEELDAFIEAQPTNQERRQLANNFQDGTDAAAFDTLPPLTQWPQDVVVRTSWKKFYQKRFEYWVRVRDAKEAEIVGVPIPNVMLRHAAEAEVNPLVHCTFDGSVMMHNPDMGNPQDTIFVKLVNRDLLYSWLDKHAQRSAYFDRRQPLMSLEAFEAKYHTKLRYQDELWDEARAEFPSTGRPSARTDVPAAGQAPQGHLPQQEVVDDHGSLDLSFSSASQMPRHPAQTSATPTETSFSVITTPE